MSDKKTFKVSVHGRGYDGTSLSLGAVGKLMPPIHVSWVENRVRYSIEYAPVRKSLKTEELKPR